MSTSHVLFAYRFRASIVLMYCIASLDSSMVWNTCPFKSDVSPLNLALDDVALLDTDGALELLLDFDLFDFEDDLDTLPLEFLVEVD